MVHHFDKENTIARKNHQCQWCLKTIKKGTKYTKQSMVDCGEWWFFKVHRLCFYVSIEANKDRRNDDYCDGPDMNLQESEIKELLRAVKKNLKLIK
tara:strand:- start:183 stop:470 length:288 start_codon:yes stop_codon:yes gene_type:complete